MILTEMELFMFDSDLNTFMEYMGSELDSALLAKARSCLSIPRDINSDLELYDKCVQNLRFLNWLKSDPNVSIRVQHFAKNAICEKEYNRFILDLEGLLSFSKSFPLSVQPLNYQLDEFEYNESSVENLVLEVKEMLAGQGIFKLLKNEGFCAEGLSFETSIFEYVHKADKLRSYDELESMILNVAEELGEGSQEVCFLIKCAIKHGKLMTSLSFGFELYATHHITMEELVSGYKDYNRTLEIYTSFHNNIAVDFRTSLGAVIRSL